MSVSGQFQNAAVIGASFAGLLASRVLSAHCTQVTLIEKDQVNDHPESRPGQAQTRHLHGLLAKCLDILEHYFPGFTQELIAHGAIYDDMGRVIRWHQFGGFRRQFDSGLNGVVQSRPLLEYLLRKRVMTMPNVRLMDQSRILGWDLKSDRITGLTVEDPAGSRRQMPFDLVVDCSGRGSNTPKWLLQNGYKPPAEEEVTVKVGYSTRLYVRKEDDLKGAKMVMALPSPPAVVRSGYLLPIEGNRWMLTVAGWGRDYPPSDTEGLNSFVRSLPAQDIYRIISHARPLSDIMTYRFTASRRMHYQRLKHLPGGIFVLGDAMASFNPVYGQGMTSAAMQATALDSCLKRNKANAQKAYFRKVATIVDTPWQLATGEDFRFKTTTGKKPIATDLVNAYVSQVHKATHKDTFVYLRFLKVMNLMRPPTTLMCPGVLWRVMRSKIMH